jgi:subtilisin-like proprotein convertase family protein
MASDGAGNCAPIPGNSIANPIPIVPNSGGTGCAVETVFNTNQEYTKSYLATVCRSGTTLGKDKFYSWTATDDTLFFIPGSGNPGFVVRDAVTGEEIVGACRVSGPTSGVDLSGWTIGQNLIIQVFDFYTADVEIGFCLEVAVERPTNNLCIDAIPILCGGTASGTTINATTTGGGAPGNDVWYSFDGTSEPAGTTVTISLCGSDFDTYLYVLDDCVFPTLVFQDNDSCGTQSELTFTNDGATNYIIQVDGFNVGASGAYSLAVTCAPPPPPSPTCGGVTTTETGATGSVPDNNCDPTNDFALAVGTATGTIGVDTDIDNVTLNITHTWTSDLAITLVAPSGAELELSTSNGGSSGPGYIDTVFRDGGPSITTGGAGSGFTGVFQAEGGTFGAAFAGEDIAGAGGWILKVCDAFTGDVGNVVSWSIGFCDSIIPDPLIPTIGTSARTMSEAEKANEQRRVDAKKKYLRANPSEREAYKKYLRANPSER